MRTAIRWGVVGLGAMAHTFMKSVQFLDDAQVIAVASRDEARAEDFAQRYGVARAYDSYSALVTNPDIDAVYVATTTEAHVVPVFHALRAKKAVYCETPLALKTEKARLMIQTARRQRVLLAEAAWLRFVPAMAQVHQWLEEERIGTVMQVQAAVHAAPGDAGAQSGALTCAGLYGVQLANGVLKSSPLRVQAMAAYDGRIDVQTVLSLGYPGFGMASVVCALAERALESASIIGTRGSIRLPDFGRCTRAELHPLHSPMQTVDLAYSGHGQQYHIDLFMRALRAGRTECPGFTLEDSLAAVRVLEEARTQMGLNSYT